MTDLYDYWQHPETKEILASFTIITTTENSMLQTIGAKRMPVILNPSLKKNWLKSDRSLTQVLHMLQPFDPKKINAYPVVDLVNTFGVNDD